MREKFELHCKTIGLVLFCIGAFYVLSSIPLFFQKQPDVTKMYSQSALKVLSQSDIAEMKISAAYLWRRALTSLVLLGIAPILMGVYLMRSNNLFVRFCYPDTGRRTSSASNGAGKPVEFKVASKAEGTAEDKKPQKRYAPPGYFE